MENRKATMNYIGGDLSNQTQMQRGLPIVDKGRYTFLPQPLLEIRSLNLICTAAH